MFHIRVFSLSAGLVASRYDCMRFLARLRLTCVSLIVHLSELAWSKKVIQSGLMQVKVLFIEEFTILPSQVKKRFNFWCGLEVDEFLSYN